MTIRRIRHALVASVLVVAVSYGAAAEAPPCPFPDQQPMLVVQLFFGQSIKGRGPITPTEWRKFLAQTVTPRFPDGFTVYDGYGQWRNTEDRRQAIAREKTKIVEIATDDTQAHRTGIYEIRQRFREQFNQLSVGIVTNPGCAAFGTELPPAK